MPPLRAPRACVPLLALVALAAGPPAEAAPEGAAGDSILYVTSLAGVNRVGLTVSNYGFVGTNFNSRAPSFEYPLGSGYDHMTRAGLWIGAVALSDTGSFVGVTTALVDNAQGSDAMAETEFTPAGKSIRAISRIANSPVYAAEAVSDQDLECSYSDVPGHAPRGQQKEAHRPLRILVRQRTLGFTLPAANSFVVAQFLVVNQGPPLQNVYLGLYAQFVSGNKDTYGTWPPSAQSTSGSWYYKTHAEYDTERRLYKEHYCAALPYPDACNFAYCPPWAGAKLLSAHPGTLESKTLSFHWWKYNIGDPADTLRSTDLKRYGFMSDGVVESDFSTCEPGKQSCSPIMLLSVGPWAQVDPGDTVRVDVAFVAGMDEDAFLTTADFAQFTSDIDYKLPSAPPSPRLHVETGEQRVTLYWDDSPESVPDPTSQAPGNLDFEGYRVYLGLDRQNPRLVAQYDLAGAPHDTVGFNTGFDAIRLDEPHVHDGVTYRYRRTVEGLKDGFNYFGAVTSYDLGDSKIVSLESGIEQNKFQAVPAPAPEERTRGITVFPNPYRVEASWDQGTRVRDHYLWFANLPSRCVLRIYTLAGDLVFETRFDGATYRGEGARGLYNPATDLDVSPPYFSGATYAWNLITRQGQAAATGLYLFAVEDLDSGRTRRGRFLIVKSDRED